MTLRYVLILVSAAVALGLFSGCSSSNSQAPTLDAINKHPADWLTKHRVAYRENPGQCEECHGKNLKGGITRVDCFNQGALTQCHSNGHGPRSVIHAVPFTDPLLHGPLAKADLLICQDCHGTPGGPGSTPRFTSTIGTLETGCEKTPGCHNAYMAHPTPWSSHGSAGNLANACALCHGASFEGGSGPACSTCHTSLTAGSIPVAGGCISCHGKPPATNNHIKHIGITGVTGTCGVCHNGAGSGTTLHNNGTTNVAFFAAYNAKTGTALIEADKTCSNISCHGGVTTPVWGGNISVAAQCESCHLAGTSPQSPQFNSYYSGQHTRHLNLVGLKCVDCHDMTVVSAGMSHFSNLDTPSFELSPARTIKVPGYATTPGSCNPGRTPQANAYSVGVCHGTENWQ